MAQDMAKMVGRLNDLIALDIDAVNAYEEAIKRVHVPVIQEKLRLFQGDHQRHIKDLTAVVDRFGGKPRAKPDVKGFFLKGFTAVTSMMGDEAALRAMHGNEKLTNKTYKDALSFDWPADVKEIIDRNYGDEQRHLAFVQESLRSRAWEEHPAHP